MDIRHALIVPLAIAFAIMAVCGCENLPGTDEQQGAVIGGAAGATAGAVIAEDNRLVGALIGGLLGAGAGYLIGANADKITGDEEEDAIAAVEEAQQSPATIEDVEDADTADLNDDGFVTLDEVVAMERAGLSDDEMIERLEDTGQVFELNASQENYLRDRGVSGSVIRAMDRINAEEREELLAGQEVISRDR